MEKFIGGPAGKVFIKLLLASLIVGMILSFLGLSPYHLVDSIIHLARRIYDLGFEAIEWIFEYIILGAIIVVPFWLISRSFSVLGQPSEDKNDETPESERKKTKVEKA